MGKLDVTKTAPGGEKRKTFNRRLNTLFQFARIDPWQLNNGAREKLLDDLHVAMYGAERKREGSKVIWSFGNFSEAATPEGISKAQRALSRFIATGKARLVKQTIELKLYDERSEFAGEYFYRFASEDFSTLVILAFAHLLDVCELRQSDFLQCANCGVTFVPQRKPRKGRPSYCTFRCANTVAVKNYRERKEKERQQKAKKRKLK